MLYEQVLFGVELPKAISYGFRTVAFFLDGGATVRAPQSKKTTVREP